MLKITTPLIRTVALTALVGTFAFAGPVHAATQLNTTQQVADDQDSSSMSAAPAAKAAPAKKSWSKQDPMMNVETRIQTLHDKLMITPDQESDWSEVAQTMRDNESTIHQLVEARHADPENMTAIDDLQSYQKITQAHADGLTKLTSAFSSVYGNMSDDQKKNADVVFGRFEGHRDMAAKNHHKKS